MAKREDYIKELRENEIFKEVLSRASSDVEKRIIKAYAEEFLNVFFDNVVQPISKEIQKDPNVVKNAAAEIEKELINSGSIKT